MAKITLIKAGVLDPTHPLITQPLGIMYLAAAVREKGHQVALIDSKAEQLPARVAAERALADSPDVVGISGFSNEWESFEEIGRFVKELNPKVLLIGGGPHATSYPTDILDRAPFDYLVLGEGELTLIEFLQKVDEGGDLSAIDGIAYRSDGECVLSSPRGKIEDLDSIPLPAYDLIDIDLYAKFISASPIGKRRYMSVFTSRGCPFRCMYCHNIFGKKFRTKSADRVIEELTLLREKYNIHDIEITDDIFNLDRDRMMEICNRIVAEKLNLRISFPNGLRGDRMDPEMITALRKAGTIMISYAVESASPRIQKLVRKNNNLDKLFETINETVRQGIFTNGFFMMGFPTETEEEVLMTTRYATRSLLHSASFFIVTPFQGTDLWELIPEETKPKSLRKWYSFHSGYVNLSEIPDERLNALRRSAYRKFYFSPTRIIRTLWRHPDKRIFLLALSILKRQVTIQPNSHH